MGTSLNLFPIIYGYTGIGVPEGPDPEEVTLIVEK